MSRCGLEDWRFVEDPAPLACDNIYDPWTLIIPVVSTQTLIDGLSMSSIPFPDICDIHEDVIAGN